MPMMIRARYWASTVVKKTKKRVPFEIREPWRAGDDRVPLYYSSPDLSAVLNEIIALPGWGKGKAGKSVLLTITDESPAGETNYVTFSDWSRGEKSMKCAARLEVFPTVYDTFLGKELVSRVTGSSAVIDLCSLIDTDTYVEYGSAPGRYTERTEEHPARPGGTAFSITLQGLEKDREYYYRLRFRRAGEGPYAAGPEGRFHTPRAPGERFRFAIQSDEHIFNTYKLPENRKNQELYRLTRENMKKYGYDFCISLGDFANTELYTGRNAEHFEEAFDRYLLQRRYLAPLSRSLPLYLVIGNHEGENGWYYASGTAQTKLLAVVSTLARKALVPNPEPDGFYTGNEENVPGIGLREDYFAWQWGDALFVCLDPFWYTPFKPHPHLSDDRYDLPPTLDGWTWTLGKAQYDWLYETLHRSKARWKLVFIHHLVSTTTPAYAERAPYYGRGGIEIAKYKVAGNPSFEWGGEDEQGRNIFSRKRPGWRHGPIHDLLVAEGVSILFHGHDHLYARQSLDGVVYQECPQPLNSQDYGYRKIARYEHGKILPNAGHLRVTVSPDRLEVAYIRTFLPGEGENGKVGYTYTLERR